MKEYNEVKNKNEEIRNDNFLFILSSFLFQSSQQIFLIEQEDFGAILELKLGWGVFFEDDDVAILDMFAFATCGDDFALHWFFLATSLSQDDARGSCFFPGLWRYDDALAEWLDLRHMYKKKEHTALYARFLAVSRGEC